jgi:hypothetical protein
MKHLRPGWVHAHACCSTILLHIILLTPLDSAWSQVFHIAVVTMTGVVWWLRWDFSKGPNRVGISPHTWGWKQIQFLKRSVLYNWMMDTDQNLSNSECHTPSSEPFRIYLYKRYGPGIYTCFRKLERLEILLAKTVSHITFLMRCKSQGSIPKGFFVKTPVSSLRSSRIAQHATTALLRDRIHFHWKNSRHRYSGKSNNWRFSQVFCEQLWPTAHLHSGGNLI